MINGYDDVTMLTVLVINPSLHTHTIESIPLSERLRVLRNTDIHSQYGLPGGTRTRDPGCLQRTDLLCAELRLVVVSLLREHDGEHGVGAAARLVHVGGGHRPVEGVRERSCDR